MTYIDKLFIKEYPNLDLYKSNPIINYNKAVLHYNSGEFSKATKMFKNVSTNTMISEEFRLVNIFNSILSSIKGGINQNFPTRYESRIGEITVTGLAYNVLFHLLNQNINANIEIGLSENQKKIDVNFNEKKYELEFINISDRTIGNCSRIGKGVIGDSYIDLDKDDRLINSIFTKGIKAELGLTIIPGSKKDEYVGWEMFAFIYLLIYSGWGILGFSDHVHIIGFLLFILIFFPLGSFLIVILTGMYNYGSRKFWMILFYISILLAIYASYCANWKSVFSQIY